MAQKNRHKNVAVFAVFLVSFFLNFFLFLSSFLLVSCFFMTSWNPKTAHQVRLQAIIRALCNFGQQNLAG